MTPFEGQVAAALTLALSSQHTAGDIEYDVAGLLLAPRVAAAIEAAGHAARAHTEWPILRGTPAPSDVPSPSAAALRALRGEP